MSGEDYSAAWSDLASGFLGDVKIDIDFDSNAFFNEYMFTEMANQQVFEPQPYR